VATPSTKGFRTQGYLVLRAAFDPGPLSREVDRALEESQRGTFTAPVEGGVIGGRYVPMTCEHTPVSLRLLDQLAVVAAGLLEALVLPTRAKSVRYTASSPWHRDATGDIASVGFAAYLEPLRAENGALRVVPRSHRGEGLALAAGTLAADSGTTIDTDPGDVIVFDEHLLHSSSGGRDRRQWRVDFVADPLDPEAEARVRAWYANQHPPDWNGGYDVDRFPSYGAHWQASGRPWVERLRALGVYDAAAREEAFARSQR
jgi:hypothetical protein